MLRTDDGHAVPALQALCFGLTTGANLTLGLVHMKSPWLQILSTRNRLCLLAIWCQGAEMGYLKNLRKVRTERGLSQVALAERLGVDQPTISKYERKKLAPWRSTIESIAKILKCEPEELL
jgi:DNA-binding XRE family transcriptional regulator